MSVHRGGRLRSRQELQLGSNRHVRIHPLRRAVRRFRTPGDGLRLPTQRLLQGIVWLLDPCRVSLELLSLVLSRFTNELFSWKTSVPIEVVEHLLKSCKAAPGQNRAILRSLLS